MKQKLLLFEPIIYVIIFSTETSVWEEGGFIDMTGKEKMLDQLKNVVLRRFEAAGLTTTPDIEDIILEDLQGEWNTYGYDAARIRAERAELTAIAQ